MLTRPANHTYGFAIPVAAISLANMDASELGRPDGGEEEGRRASGGGDETRNTGGETGTRPEQPGRPDARGPGGEDGRRAPAETRTREEYADEIRGQGDPIPSRDDSSHDPAGAPDRGTPASEPGDDRAAERDLAEPRDRETYAADMRAGGIDGAGESAATGDDQGVAGESAAGESAAAGDNRDAPGPGGPAADGSAGQGAEPAEPRSREEYADAVRQASFEAGARPDSGDHPGTSAGPDRGTDGSATADERSLAGNAVLPEPETGDQLPPGHPGHEAGTRPGADAAEPAEVPGLRDQPEADGSSPAEPGLAAESAPDGEAPAPSAEQVPAEDSRPPPGIGDAQPQAQAQAQPDAQPDAQSGDADIGGQPESSAEQERARAADGSDVTAGESRPVAGVDGSFEIAGHRVRFHVEGDQPWTHPAGERWGRPPSGDRLLTMEDSKASRAQRMRREGYREASDVLDVTGKWFDLGHDLLARHAPAGQAGTRTPPDAPSAPQHGVAPADAAGAVVLFATLVAEAIGAGVKSWHERKGHEDGSKR